MRLNAPRKGLWIFSIILAVASLIAHFIDPLSLGFDTSFWVMGAAWMLLFLATYLKNY